MSLIMFNLQHHFKSIQKSSHIQPSVHLIPTIFIIVYAQHQHPSILQYHTCSISLFITWITASKHNTLSALRFSSFPSTTSNTTQSLNHLIICFVYFTAQLSSAMPHSHRLNNSQDEL